MDTGREYTERWHHQMQIRSAMSVPLLLEPMWMEPVLDFSVRALPHAYAAVPARPGTTITLLVHGETEGAWSVVRDGGAWKIVRGQPDSPDATASLETDDAWRLFYNALSMDDVSTRVRVTGDARLVEPLLRARAVIV